MTSRELRGGRQVLQLWYIPPAPFGAGAVNSTAAFVDVGAGAAAACRRFHLVRDAVEIIIQQAWRVEHQQFLFFAAQGERGRAKSLVGGQIKELVTRGAELGRAVNRQGG